MLCSCNGRKVFGKLRTVRTVLTVQVTRKLTTVTFYATCCQSYPFKSCHFKILINLIL